MFVSYFLRYYTILKVCKNYVTKNMAQFYVTAN
jgi:hypothetical protein